MPHPAHPSHWRDQLAVHQVALLRLGMLCTFLAIVWCAVPQAVAGRFSGIAIEIRANGQEHISFLSDDAITPRKSFLLTNPDRVVVDIPTAQASGIRLPSNSGSRLVKGVRFGQFDAATSRIVLDVTTPVTLIAVTGGSPLTLDITPTRPLAAIPPSPPIATAFPAKTSAGKPIAQTAKSITPPEDMKPMVAIDAGHGGQDPGAIGVHGTHERDVTLQFAKALRKALLQTGRYRVILTREDDRFILLKDRVEIARKANADMFISFHADSNPQAEARGLSLYTVSATASDDEAAALAERENKSDILPGIDLNTTDADVANILIDLTQRETLNKSTQLADTLVEKLHPKITKINTPHRFAGFRVLKAPDVPSVLIELGFLSNETDEKLLRSEEYRDLVVSSLVKGLDRYFVTR